MEEALLEMLTMLRPIVTRPPVLIRGIVYQDADHFDVEYLPLVGTGRPIIKSRQVTTPGVLRADQIYAWGDKGGAPLPLTPLMHFNQELSALFMLSGLDGGAPVYSSCEKPDARHRPDKLMASFEQRAPFLLKAPEPVATSSRPAAASEAYARAVSQAMSDGVVTTDEWELLRAMRTGLGLSDEEVAGIHAEYGVPPQPTCSPSTMPEALAADSRREQLVIPKPAVAALPAPPPSLRFVDSERKRTMEKARQLDLADDIVGALEAYRGLLEKNPSDVDARIAVVNLLCETSLYDDAERAVREGLELVEDARLEAWFSSVLLNSNRSDEAFEHAQRSIDLDAKCVEAHLALAECFEFTGEIPEQREHLNIALALAPEDPAVLASRASSLSVLGEDPKKVLQEVRKALRTAPRDRRLRGALASALRSAGLSADELAEYEALVARNPRCWHARIGHALALSTARRFDEALAAAEEAQRLSSSNPLVQVVRAVVCMSQGEMESADAALREAYRRLPGSPVVGWFNALLLRARSDYDAAEAELRRVLVLASEYTDARILLGQTLRDKGRSEQAMQELRTVLDKQPDNAEAKLRLAEVLSDLERYDESAELLKSLEPEPDVVVELARIDIARGRTVAAEAALRDLRKRAPSHAQAGWWHISALGLLGRGDAAQRVFEEIESPGTDAKLLLAQARIRCSQLAEARRLLDAVVDDKDLDAKFACDLAHNAGFSDLRERFAQLAVQKDPDSAEARYKLGSFLYELGNTDGAEAELRAAVAIDPNHGLALNSLGLLLERKGCAGEAVELLRSVLRLDAYKNNPTVRLNIAEVMVRSLGDLAGGMEAARAAFELQSDGSAHSEFAEVLRDAGHLDAAEEVLLEAFKLVGELPYMKGLLATIRSAQGRDEDALRIWREVEKVAGNDANTQHQIALVLQKLGRDRQALVSFRKAYELMPNDANKAVGYAACLVRLRDFARARTVFEDLIKEGAPPASVLDWWLGQYVGSNFMREGLELARDLQASIQDQPILVMYEGICLKELDDIDAAMPLLEQSTRQFPGYGRHLGECLLRKGRAEEALDVFVSAVEANPAHPKPRRALIQCLVQMGHRDWARDELQRLVDIEGSPADLQELRDIVETEKVLN